MTSEQIKRVYDTKMRNIMLKNARIKKEQADADREAIQKRNKLYGDISAGLSIAGMTKDLYEWRQGKLLDKRYKEDENILGALTPFKKYKVKQDRPVMEVLKDPIESIKRLTPRGSLEETEGYKEFQALEETGVAEESLKGWINPETGEQGTAQEYAKLVKERQLSWQADEEMALLEEQLAQKAEIAAQEAADIQQLEMEEEELAEKLEIANIENAKFNQYGLTKVRAEELADILEREGVVLPEGMTEEKTLELLSSFDKVPMGKNPVGTAQPEYRAFVDTLKSGGQNPDTFQSVVTDLTTNADETIQSVIEGTYTPEVEDVSYERDLLAEDAAEIEALKFDPITGEEIVPAGKISPTDYTVGRLSEEQNLQLKREQAGFDFGQLTTEKEALNIDPITGQPLPVKGEISPTDYTVGTQEDINRVAAEKFNKLHPSGRSMQEVERMLPQKPPLSFREGTLPKTVTAEPRVPEGATRITELDPMGDVDLSRRTPSLPESVGVVPEYAGPEGAQITTTVPDAKSGLGRFAGKAFNVANLQTGRQIFNLGKTLTDKDATGEDKTVAATQGAKMLADLAAKHAGQQTASQIGTKAASDYFAKKGLQEGVKLGGKAAVGAVAGGVLGGYTMATEAGEAKESWEEGDYDEAILHGISSVSGGLQTAGAGMMLSGIGAPLGAVLYGVGTAASVISSGAQLLEGLFGGDGSAPAIPEVKMPKFNAGRYLDSIRRRSSYAY